MSEELHSIFDKKAEGSPEEKPALKPKPKHWMRGKKRTNSGMPAEEFTAKMKKLFYPIDHEMFLFYFTGLDRRTVKNICDGHTPIPKWLALLLITLEHKSWSDEFHKRVFDAIYLARTKRKVPVRSKFKDKDAGKADGAV